MDHAHGARDIQFSTIATVLLIAQLDRTIMERLVLLVLPHKSGTVQNVLIDVIQVKSGMPPHKPVSAHQDSSGTDMHALFVPTERPGISTLKAANAQFPQLGTESPASFVLEAESTTTSRPNANAPQAKHTTVTFAL